ncbi:MAG TPA: hypothetical protein VEZ11_15675 [Thermoanaerobaculia bacterium]|nr:hypothetical protein [Thermoanaerobaculia bacterium]
MKRILSAVAVFFLIAAAAPVLAVQTKVVDDVIRMSKAGVSDDSIIAFLDRAPGNFEVTADDIIAMNDAGLSKQLIKAVVDEAAARGKDHREVVYAPRYAGPYYPYYDPWYDPYWYSPRVAIGLGFGFGFHGGHHFGHRRW